MVNLFSNSHYNFDRRVITAKAVNDVWCVDLVDLSSKNAGYILNCVDIFSRYAQSVKLTSKTTSAIENGFNEIINLFGAKPANVWSDKEGGLVALSGYFKKNGINLYHTENSYHGADTHSVPIVERFNRTMRDAMMKYKQSHPNQNYKQLAVNTIKNFIPEYNKKVHSTIKITPAQAYSQNHNNELIKNQNERANEKRTNGRKYNVGDKIHLQKPFAKIRSKYETKYYKEPLKIASIRATNPVTYTLENKGNTGYYSKQFIA